MPLAVNEIVQLTYKGQYAGQRIMLVTNWKVVSNTSTDPLITDLNKVITLFKATGAADPLTKYLACLATNATITVVRAQVVRPSRSLFMEDYITQPGTGAGSARTGNIASTVTRVSQAAGRKGVSTSHLGPIPDVSSLAGSLEAAQIAANDAWATEFIADQVAGAAEILLTPVILHPVGALITSSTIVTYRLGATTRTMRRRTVGVGE